MLLDAILNNRFKSSPWPIPSFNVMTKPGGPACNLACSYCYYRHKTDTLHHGQGGSISEELLERFIREYIASQDAPTIFFSWQGGEPTLMGLEFYRKVVQIQKKYAPPGVDPDKGSKANSIKTAKYSMITCS